MNKTRAMAVRFLMILIALSQFVLADGLPSTLGGK
jgi:hypothetical protein